MDCKSERFQFLSAIVRIVNTKMDKQIPKYTNANRAYVIENTKHY